MKKLIVIVLITNLNIGKAQNSISAYCNEQPVFNTLNELNVGKSQVNQVNVSIQRQTGQNSLSNWKLTVRLLQDYTYLNKTIGAQYSALQYNTQTNSSDNTSLINFGSSPFVLSKFSETVLINSTIALKGMVNRLFSFNLNIQGGNQLLDVPNGSYQSAYEFKLYEVKGNSDVLISSYTTTLGNSAGFTINYSGNVANNTIALQNGADQFNLAFANAADFVTGKSNTVTKGLKVTSDSNYQLSVKAANTFLTSATTSTTLPVSILKVGLATSTSINGLTIYSPLTLSASDQIIAIRTAWIPTIEYDLTFSILPNTLGMNLPSATYSTFVYFVLTPN
jgi:hypothetical protein